MFKRELVRLVAFFGTLVPMSARRRLIAIIAVCIGTAGLCWSSLSPAALISPSSKKAKAAKSNSPTPGEAPTVVSITAEPSAIALYGPRAEGRVVVTGRDRLGRVCDLTSIASIAIDNSKIASIGADRVILPV